MERAKHIFRLGVKELISLSQDAVLIFLILYSFTFAIYTPAKSAVMDVVNASIAIVKVPGQLEMERPAAQVFH